MRKLFFGLAVLLAASCTAEVHTSTHPWIGRYRELPVPVQEYSHPEGDTVAYVLAVEYAEGVDWRRDGGPCNLSVYASQKKILSIPVEDPLSADADRNRLIGSHLYSDCFEGMETVVYTDGVEAFRYGGRELFVGMMLSEEGLWTLGQGVSGGGFSLRCDGNEVFSRASGTIIGDHDPSTGPALYYDGESLCFCYCSEVGGLYVVRDAQSESCPLEDQLQRIYDARSVDGCLYAVGESVDGHLFVYADGGRVTSFDLSFAKAIFSVRIIPVKGGPYIKVAFMLEDGSEGMCVWGPGNEILLSSDYITDLYFVGGNIYYFGTAEDGRETPFATKLQFLGEGDRMYSPYCALFLGDSPYAAVTPSSDLMYPYLLAAGRRLAIPVNGYLIGVNIII